MCLQHLPGYLLPGRWHPPVSVEGGGRGAGCVIILGIKRALRQRPIREASPWEGVHSKVPHRNPNIPSCPGLISLEGRASTIRGPCVRKDKRLRMPHEHLGSAFNPPPPPGALALHPQVSVLSAPSPEAGLQLSSSPPTLKGSLPTISFRVLQEVHSLQRWEDQARTLASRLLGFPG